MKKIFAVTLGFVFAMAGVINYVPHSTYAIFPVFGVLTGYIYIILAIANKYKKNIVTEK